MRRLALLLLAFAILFELPAPAATKAPATRSAARGKSLQKTTIKKKNRRASARRTKIRVRGRRGRLRRIFIPWSPVKGSRESLLRQNERTEELERIEDDEQLFELTQAGALVELPANDYAAVAGNLPRERRYCRPWTRAFVEDFGRDYYEQFQQPLMVTSAVRTVAVQKKLRRRNRNAADIDGDLASPHLTGATIDIGKRGMTRKQLNWIREYLLEQQNRGVIDVAEEFRQRVFHITVYKDYELTKSVAASEEEAPAPEDGFANPVLTPALATPAAAPAGSPADQPR
ncbi:MAG TPA: DUF5715 family protein [Terriglobales bacterium]|nr:DUF5715 family protein [Terriglobales bacterium]